MNQTKWRGLPLLAAAIAVVSLIAVTAVALLGATPEDQTVGPRDTAQMRRYISEFWAARQVTWPEEYRGNNQKKLPDGMKKSLLESCTPVIDKVTTGRIHDYWKSFDPGGFIEELRASGSVVTDSGFEIVSMGEPTLTADDTAEVLTTVRSWSEQYEVDDGGKAKGKPYKTVNDLEYRYVFERVGGVWQLSSGQLLNNPV